MLATVFLDIHRVNVSDVNKCFYFSETYITDKVTSVIRCRKLAENQHFSVIAEEFVFKCPMKYTF